MILGHIPSSGVGGHKPFAILMDHNECSRLVRAPLKTLCEVLVTLESFPSNGRTPVMMKAYVVPGLGLSYFQKVCCGGSGHTRPSP